MPNAASVNSSYNDVLLEVSPQVVSQETRNEAGIIGKTLPVGEGALRAVQGPSPQGVSQEATNETGIIGKTLAVGEGVLRAVVPHVIATAPWYLSRMTNLRLLSLAGIGCCLEHHISNVLDQTNRSWLDIGITGVQIANDLCMGVDLFAPISHPVTRVAVDSLLILGTVLGSSRAISDGARRLFLSWNDEELSTTSRVKNFVSGALSTIFGVAGIGKSLQVSLGLVPGVQIFQTLDPEQQKGVIAFRAVHTLGGTKSCNAVTVVDYDAHSPLGTISPLTEILYANCDTRAYAVASPEEFCQVLERAKEDFGAPIDVLELFGHGNNRVVKLGSNYRFSGSSYEGMCMDRALAPNAQVFLASCNTATPFNDGTKTLTEKVAERIPGRWVTGFSSYYNPFLTTTSISEEGHISHDNHFPVSLNGLHGFSSAVTHRILPADNSQWTSFFHGILMLMTLGLFGKIVQVISNFKGAGDQPRPAPQQI